MPETISEYPRHQVRRPVMFQDWRCVTFLHWAYDAAVLSRLIPDRLELDTFDGSAWVGLTPFLLTGLRPPWAPVFPWISQFPEMNVRTYVRGPEGERGIWFFSLEAGRLAAVAGARISYGLPYRWAAMRVHCDTQQVEYESKRHFGHGTARCVIRRVAPIRANELEVFLTARFRLYTRWLGRLAFAQVEHEPWPLESARAVKLEQDVLEHSGLPSPRGTPLIHFSPGVYVRIGRPTLFGTAINSEP